MSEGRTASRTTYRAAGGGGNAVYGLGFVGALVYYWIHAGSFWEYLLAFLQAIVWPAFVVYELLEGFYG